MADSSDTALLQPDAGVTIPRISLQEQGFTGLKVTAGHIVEETNRAFRYPQFARTVNEMRIQPTVAAAFNVYHLMMGRVKWNVKPPVGATPEQLARTKFISQCKDDMETSFEEFISSVFPYLEYGYALNEKVFRRRLTSNGSRYNDGLVGLRKLPTRSQTTVREWLYDEKNGRDLVGVKQSLVTLENALLSNVYVQALSNGKVDVDIPIEKLLHFKVDPVKENPEGSSILKPIYLAYKRLEQLTDLMLLSSAKDSQGLPLMRLPPKFLDPNASAEDAAVYAACKSIADNLASGTQNSIIFPTMTDPESKLDMFGISLLETKGTPKINLLDAIKAMQSDILCALNADVVKLGAESQGSFSLADSKVSLLAMAVDRRLGEIASVLNFDLVPSIYKMNGWSLDEELPTFSYEDTQEVSLDEFAGAVQRIWSSGAIEFDRDAANLVRKRLGLKELPADQPVDKDKLPVNMSEMSSSAGKGMQPGTTGQGTAKNGTSGSGDNSISNKANK